jgi:hypothetical protein
MAFPSLRILWGCNPGFLDTDTIQARGIFRTLVNVVVDPTGGYHNAVVDPTGVSGALTFGGSPSANFGPDEIEDNGFNYAAKWPRFVPDGLHFSWGDRFWLDSNPASVTPIALVFNQEGFCNLSLCIDTSGHLCVWRGLPDGSHPLHEELWNSGVALALGEWHRLGFWGLISSVNGWFDVYQNSVHLVFKDAQVTHVHALVAWTGLGYGGDANMLHSHLWMGCGVPNYDSRFRRGGFLSLVGDPIADGAYTGGTSTEATNYEAIDETPADDAATRIDLLTVGEKYSIRREDLLGTRTILGAQNTIRFSRPEDSPYALRQFLAVNDVLYPSTTIAADAAGDWGWDQDLRLVDPSNGLPFTRARLNSETVTTEHGALVHGSASV